MYFFPLFCTIKIRRNSIFQLFDITLCVSLAHAKSFAALADGNDECPLELLVALVVGQTELIEACVGGRQAICHCWCCGELELWI